jgi:hypothetical protein
MKALHRSAIAVAALLLCGLYALPMWRITLEAPQYPKGNELGILISIDKVEGARPHDLQNLNGLNHYIGMKPIDADAIPELKYMPIVVGVLVGIGLLVAAIGKRSLILVWLALLLIAGALGMYDFYMWEYDYGHNLDPHAAIRIEGMSYQPPLIGSKQLLNFTAHSYPAVGFYLIIASGALAISAWWFSRKRV